MIPIYIRFALTNQLFDIKIFYGCQYEKLIKDNAVIINSLNLDLNVFTNHFRILST